MQTPNSKSAKKLKAPIHCPVSGCLYFYGSERFFTEKKFLNQHIAKVHAEKKYPCTKCEKSFGSDWFRKHHEKTCGLEWKCPCGLKYASRETLLTHARRNQHKLPDHVLNLDKGKQNKCSTMDKKNPVILLIQPIIQYLTCIQPGWNASTQRPILPKTLPLQMAIVPSSAAAEKNMCNLVYSSPVFKNEEYVYNSMPQNTVNDPLNTHLLSSTNCSTQVVNNIQKQSVIHAGTQTSNDFVCPHKPKESRASQCTRRKSKAADVGIESTHTQTAESAVVKIKRKRSRRKSVAITTEPSMLSEQDLNTGNSLWPNFKDLIFSDNCGNRGFKNTTSTQTGTNKILCDSETLTDDELFKLVWDDTVRRKDSSDSCNSPFGILPDITVDDSLSAIANGLSAENLSTLNMFSSNNSIEDTHNKSLDYDVLTASSNPINKEITDESCSAFSVFADCTKQDLDSKVSPILSDIHTQTITSNDLDYNMLANMQTQTTDDFLYDLEFLDTETQTPWDDFPSIDDSPLPADQLSIEIQTDFPYLSSGMDQDPYDFINNLNVQNINNDCSIKEPLGVNIETQTHDWMSLTQFTNSESQTLDLANSNLMF
ncbi:uncharacterized protein TNCT_571591 [Trichonephila clavata]|uniref:C2H2-type domain-containing protein n=1 Tax=Trichonephila clavata TaxID=2740835 RepID=A0A8X6K6J0_TRICU|nr:uncharacterized protein TNCT_571591 [Trichonephila clavata]